MDIYDILEISIVNLLLTIITVEETQTWNGLPFIYDAVSHMKFKVNEIYVLKGQK